VAALCRSYASHGEALEAVNAVLGAGIPGEDVLVLIGEPPRDAHEEQVGEFAGPTEPGAPVGDSPAVRSRRGLRPARSPEVRSAAGASPMPTASCSPAIRTAWSEYASSATVASHAS
jgi:hypothetical protein